MRSNLSIFYFIGCAFSVIARKSLPQDPKDFILYFLLKVLYFTFRSLICFGAFFFFFFCILCEIRVKVFLFV